MNLERTWRLVREQKLIEARGPGNEEKKTIKIMEYRHLQLDRMVTK